MPVKINYKIKDGKCLTDCPKNKKKNKEIMKVGKWTTCQRCDCFINLHTGGDDCYIMCKGII